MAALPKSCIAGLAIPSNFCQAKTMQIITLTTDFGIGDYDTGVLHGVILGIAPDARLVDLTHAIPAHDIRTAAILLGRAAPYFPPGTIHMAVVDPGVGTSRRAIAARLGEQYFVGPDNGLLTLMLNQAELPPEIVQLNRPDFWLAEVSPIFHGRDIFSPVAAHLARRVKLAELGRPIHDPVLLDIPRPQPIHQGWRGEVVQIDAFGNLATNLEKQHARAGSQTVRVGGAEIHGLVLTFGDGKPGDLVALFDSSDRLSVCEVNGSAAHRLNARTGDPVELIYYP
jgi:S-adenosylmethionine hydrolase